MFDAHFWLDIALRSIAIIAAYWIGWYNGGQASMKRIYKIGEEIKGHLASAKQHLDEARDIVRERGVSGYFDDKRTRI